MNFAQGIFQWFIFLLPWQTIYITREVFIQEEKWQWASLGFYATQLLLWAGIISFGYQYFQNIRQAKSKGEFEFSFTKDRLFFALCLLFIVYCVSSTFWAIDKDVALQQSLLVMQSLILFIVLLSRALDTRKLAKWFVAGAALASLLAMGQFFSQQTFSSSLFGLTEYAAYASGTAVVQVGEFGRYVRAYGPFPHPNIMGGYAALALLVAIMLAKSIPVKPRERLPLLLSIIIISSALFLSFSRSAWLTFGVGACLLFVIQASSRKFIVLSLVTLCMYGLVYWPFVEQRIVPTQRIEVASLEYRASGNAEAKEIIDSRVLLGSGVGNYTHALRLAQPDRSVHSLAPVHNTFLLTTAELGLIGVFLLIGLILAFVYMIGWSKSMVLTLSILPVLLFDHYLYSSYVGLTMMTIYFGFVCSSISKKC